MSGTHSHTAEAQADLQRADVQHRKPNIPPGHVEAERPVRRLGLGQIGPFVAVGFGVIAAAIAIVIWTV